MLQCPFCAYTCTTKQQLVLHLRMKPDHKPHWKGSIEKSIPEGFDIGTPDPEAIAKWRAAVTKASADRAAKKGGDADESVQERRKRQLSWYHSLSPKQKKERAARAKKLRQLRTGGRPTGCPYCDYTTKAQGGVTRHIKREHPNETGLVHLGSKGSEQMGNHSPNLTDRIMELVADKIAAQILKGIN